MIIYKLQNEWIMREFKKTERRKWYMIMLEFIFPSWFGHHDNQYNGFRGHNNRMEKRRRKSMFDRY